MNLEDFKVIVGYPNYMVSPSGDVWDVGQQKLLRWIMNGGFMCVNMYDKSDKKVLKKIHQTVYLTYVDPALRKQVKLEHSDGNKLNNHFTNIQKKPRIVRGAFFQELYLHNPNPDMTNAEHAKTVWYNLMSRCYEIGTKNYKYYGAKGVTVCEAWHDFDTFFSWFMKQHISGFALDKDFLYGATEYNPVVCVFIPRNLNSLIAKVGTPIVHTGKRGNCRLETSINSTNHSFLGKTPKDCYEQLELARTLQLEKLLWLMNDYIKKEKLKNPNSPEIDPRVIDKISSLIS